MTLQIKKTRFRAYQLGNEGASFSYFDSNHFTLIEARLNEVNEPNLNDELEKCGKEYIDTLHITSWDNDHCSASELKEILDKYKPRNIEYPGYEHTTNNYENSLGIIEKYKIDGGTQKLLNLLQTRGLNGNTITKQDLEKCTITIQKIDPDYINNLEKGSELAYKDIVYHPKVISESSNDNSTVKLFRVGCFNVASLGDVESRFISTYLQECKIFSSEVDILILAHHGADNGFTTDKFIKIVNPTVAICSSNYDNQFGHNPKDNIKQILYENGVKLVTTKKGDVIIESYGKHTHQYKVTNLISNSEEVSSVKEYESKKSYLLRLNEDTIKNRYKNTPFWKQFRR